MAPRGRDRRLVHEVLQVGADHAGRCRCHVTEVHLRRERNPAGMDGQDASPTVLVRRVHRYAPVEAARTQQRGVEDLGPVRGGEDDHPLGAGEPVHLYEDLVKRLLSLVMSSGLGGAATACSPYRVELVDEHDGRCALPGLAEQVPHPGRAHPRVQLDEVGPGDGEEGHARLPGDGPRQECLARAGRSVEQDALRDAGADGLEARR